MEWPLINAKDGAQAVAQANYPEIHLFTVEKKTSATQPDDVQGHWVAPQLKTPIGLIHKSWGGTPAESWTSYAALAANPELKPILDRYQESLKSLPDRQKDYERLMAEWEKNNIYLDPGNKGEALGYASDSVNAA